MAKQKKMVVKVLAPKIKIVKEIKKEEAEPEEPREEVSLEDMTSGAPSPRAFPSFAQNGAQLASQEVPDVPQPAAETKEENAPKIYAIQKNVTERDIARSYDARSPGAQRTETAVAERRAPLALPERESRAEFFRNREVEALRNQAGEGEEDKYTITPEMPHKSKEKKYPWEA